MTIYNIIYETTNEINNKIYVGVHATDKLDDGYLGSGLALKRALKKHGRKNFTRRILSMHDTYDDALAGEKIVVTEGFVRRVDTYNIKLGGLGGLFGPVSEETRAKLSAAHMGNIHSTETKLRMSKSQKGRKTSEKTKTKISQSRMGHGVSAETRVKISAAAKVQQRGPHSAETKAKMSARARARVKKECPHCSREFSPSPYARYHGDKCKQKP